MRQRSNLVTLSELIGDVDTFEYYQGHWCEFIEDFLLTPKGEVEKIDYKIDDPQREIINAVNHNLKTTAVTAKGVGKTASASWMIIAFTALYDKPKVAVTAPAGTQLNTA